MHEDFVKKTAAFVGVSEEEVDKTLRFFFSAFGLGKWLKWLAPTINIPAVGKIKPTMDRSWFARQQLEAQRREKAIPWRRVQKQRRRNGYTKIQQLTRAARSEKRKLAQLSQDKK